MLVGKGSNLGGSFHKLMIYKAAVKLYDKFIGYVGNRELFGIKGVFELSELIYETGIID